MNAILFLAAAAIFECNGQTTIETVPTTLKTTTAVTFNPGILPTTPREKCPAKIDDIDVVESGDFLNVNWSTKNAENCMLKYEIKWKELNLKSMEKTMDGTSYQIKYKPCTEYNITVAVYDGNTNEEIDQKWATYQTKFDDKISQIDVQENDENLIVTWSPNQYADICKTSYIVNISTTNHLDFPPYYYNGNVTRHYKPVERCSTYQVKIQSKNQLSAGKEYSQTKTIAPGAVQNLLVLNSDQHTDVTWDPPIDANCQNLSYSLTIDKLMETTSQTSLRVNQSFYCVDIGVSAVYEDAEGVQTFTIIAGPIENITWTESSTSIEIEWSIEDISCVSGYQLWITPEDGKTHITNTTSYEFQGLFACALYTVKIAALNVNSTAGPISTISPRTDLLLPIGAVKDIKFIQSSNYFYITWLPPEYSKYCISQYNVTVWDQNNVKNTSVIAETFIDISSIVPCMEYNVEVVPIVNATIQGEENSGNNSAAPQAPSPPVNLTLTIDKTAVMIDWTVDDCEINMCEITKIVVNCYSLDEPFWVMHNATREQTITGNHCMFGEKRPNIMVTIDGLSEFTNYTCTAVVTNTGGDSDSSQAVNFQTQPEVPNQPLDISVSNKSSNYFEVTWTEPNKIPGVLEKYRITIFEQEALHFVPEDCSEEVNRTYPFEVPADVTGFYFDQAHPHYSYSIYVEAYTIEFGPPSGMIFTSTSSDVSEAPRNLTATLKDKTNAVLNWLYPCNTNGNLLGFKIYIDGEPLPGTIGDLYNKNDSVVLNNPIDLINYEYVISDIRGSYNYAIKIVVFGETYSSDEAKTEFQSPEGYPGPPILHDIVDVNSTYFNVNWDIPQITNGKLVNYNVTIASNGPQYFIPEECSELNDITVEQTPGDVLTYRFDNAKPSYKYDVYVQAATNTGFGAKSVTKTISTLHSTPEAPRSLNFSLDDQQTQINYLVKVELTWELPCDTRGGLDHFLVSIRAESLLDGSVVDGNIVVEPNVPLTNTSYFLLIEDMLAHHYYTMVITGITGGDEGEPAEVNFTSPEGYPGPPILGEIIEVTSTSFKIVWDEPLKINGQLIYYNVTIVSQGAQHFVPEGCEVLTGTEVIQIAGDVLSYNFIGAKANYKYEVYVQAATNKGFGVASEVKMTTTLQSKPEIPRAINYTLEDQQTETDYNVEVGLTWELPCDTRGDLMWFNLQVQGVSLLDHTSEYNNNSIILPNFPLTANYSERLVDILPFFNYTISIAGVTYGETGESISINFDSPEGYPSAPSLGNFYVSETSIKINWQKPSSLNGNLGNYKVTIYSKGPNYPVPSDCSVIIKIEDYETYPDVTTYLFNEARPMHNYEVYVRASTGQGFGPRSPTKRVLTPESVPESVRNPRVDVVDSNEEVYNTNVTVQFLPPCNMFGTFSYYQVELFGTRFAYSNHEEINTIQNYEQIFGLRAEYSYTISIRAITETHNGREYTEMFQAPSGVPPSLNNAEISPIARNDTTASVTLNSQWFDTINGDILYYALIVAQQGYEEASKYGRWNNSEDSWPFVGFWANDVKPYQATPVMWNPFTEVGRSDHPYDLGVEVCSNDQEYCNGPLKPQTNYAFKIRAFTETGYRDSKIVYFSTLETPVYPDLGLILGLTFGLLTAATLLGFIYILWRRRRTNKVKKISVISIPSYPAPVPIKVFPQYYADVKENATKLKTEYASLGAKGTELALPSLCALLPENKKKNRYTNILPYDETRVKLFSDNEETSDYINASYIKGYRGKVEYIATQGPLAMTCNDFWRMIIQENVAVIVMAAQFVELNKEKCHRYFPNNHENMDVGDGIEVRCSTELNFGTHCVRTLMVQKDMKQLTVTHLQFLGWPDFGCPTGTSGMLQFCQLMRQHKEKHSGPIVIHCSAGVGRTGTLIAVDILLQTIRDDKEIDIYNTVFNLRKQRAHMVQSEKQYIYIHTCMNDAIENPLAATFEIIQSEPIYENIEDIKANSDEKLLVHESIL